MTLPAPLVRTFVLAAVLAHLPAQFNAVLPGAFPNLSGSAPGDDHGAAVLRIHDVDGDGIRDLVIGAPGYLGVGYSSGRLVFTSGAGGTTLFATPGEAGDLLGEGLALVGDLDADGNPDLVASARGRNRVLWISSATGLVLAKTVGGTSFGWPVTALPDVTGDGIPDVAISSPYDVAGGSVAVISGMTQKVLGAVSSSVPGAEFGVAVAAIPDRDGDGSWDLAVGAPHNGGTWNGALYLVSTRTFTRLNGGNPLRTGGGNLGSRVALASDIDGDGIREIAVSSPRLGFGASGDVQFVSPGNGYTHRTLAPNQSVQGFGLALAIDSDLDGDLVLDTVIGAPGYDATGITDAGAVYAFSGRDGRLLFSYAGAAAGDALGTRLAGVGDMNGNGTHEIAAFAAQRPAPVTGTGYLRMLGYADPKVPPMGELQAGLLGTTLTAEFLFTGVAATAPYVVLVSQAIAPNDVQPGLRVHVDLADPLVLLPATMPSLGTAAGTDLYWQGGAGNLVGGRAAFSLRLPASGPGLTFFCEAFAVAPGGTFRPAATGIVTLAFTERFAPASALLTVAPTSWGLPAPVVLFRDLANPGSPLLSASQLPAGYVAQFSTGPNPSFPGHAGPNPSFPGLSPTPTGASYDPPGSVACAAGPNPAFPGRSAGPINLLAVVTSPSGQTTAFSAPTQTWTGDCPVLESRLTWLVSGLAIGTLRMHAGVGADGVTAVGGVASTNGWPCLGSRKGGGVGPGGNSAEIVVANPCCAYLPSDHTVSATPSSITFYNGQSYCLGLGTTPAGGGNFKLHFLRSVYVYRTRL